MKVFKLQRKVNTIAIAPTDVYATINYKNGTTEKKEFYYGTSFLSQSARFMETNSSMANVTITDSKGQNRTGEIMMHIFCYPNPTEREWELAM